MAFTRDVLTPALHPIRSPQDYAVNALNALLDAGAADEDHHLADLAATLGELVAEYEASHLPAPAISPAELLKQSSGE